METENLHFKINLGGTYKDVPPEYVIKLNDAIVANGTISTQSGELRPVEFDSEVAEGKHDLQIEFVNKSTADNNLLNIGAIEIDEFDIGPLLLGKSHFTPTVSKIADGDIVDLRIGLIGEYWGEKRPEFEIILNDTVLKRGFIDAKSGEIEYHEFKISAADITKLQIGFLNKEDEDVLKDSYEDPNNFNVLGDLLLHLKSIEINGKELVYEIYNGVYTGTDPERPVLDSCTSFGWKGVWELSITLDEINDGLPDPTITMIADLGWNGLWHLPFESPFYIWLLENI